MSFHYSRSIRAKLILLFTATASLTVLIACASLWFYQLMNYRAALLKEESASVQLVAESSAPALLFNDAAAASETLSLLRSDTRVRMACLYNLQGSVVAHFNPPGEPRECPAAHSVRPRFDRTKLILVQSIGVKGEVVGLLFVDVGLSEMYKLLENLAAAGACVMILATIFALGLSSLLERLISRPILHLTAVAAQVSTGTNYLLRAHRDSEDETGILIDQFNLMMDRVQQRDAELQQARTGLEDRVRERTRDLRNEIAERKIIERDLEAARHLAEQSNQAKSSFVANMSHELRTPLNAIIGYSEMLYEDAVSTGIPGACQDLEKILSSARHLLSLISDILDFSKIEAGEMTLNSEFVMSSDILQDVLATAEVLAKANRNTLVLTEPVWRGAMYVDLLRFRQSMLNLLSNACKFTEVGTISVSITQQSEGELSWIVWSVSDTGIGIAPADCKKLFHTFSQVDSSNTRRVGGSGLGLAISRQLCEAMGGHITIQSKVGFGSQFSIYIPYKLPDRSVLELGS